MSTAISTRKAIAAEQRDVGIGRTARRERVGPACKLAKIGEVADVAGAQRFDDAEQQAAQHRAPEIADAAQHCCRKRLQSEQEAHLVLRDAIVGADHHPGHGTQAGADDEGERDHGVDVDAHQAGDLLVLRGCAHRDAELGAVDESEQAGHHQDRDHDDGDLHVGNRGAVRIAREVERDDCDDLREGHRIAAPDDHRQVLQDDRKPDGGDQRRQSRRVAQRPVGDAFERVTYRHARGHRDEHAGCKQDQRGQADVGAGQRGDHRHGDHRPDHHHLAMGEIDELDDPVDHRVTQGHDGVDAAQREAIDQLLQQDVHAGCFLASSGSG
jgi:hypothetical protein